MKITIGSMAGPAVSAGADVSTRYSVMFGVSAHHGGKGRELYGGEPPELPGVMDQRKKARGVYIGAITM